jgi:hypothetical protein
MQTTSERGRLWAFRRMLAKAAAPVIALLILFVFLLGPMYLFRMYAGIPLDAEGPRGELWLIVLGIVTGGGAAHAGFSSVLARLGGFTEDQIDALWHDREIDTAQSIQ